MADFALAQRKPMTEDDVLNFMLDTKLSEAGENLLDRVRYLVRAVERFHGIT